MATKLNNVTKTFGTKTVLDAFSYTFPDRGIVAITGASGTGKTTLLKIISGLSEITSGDVEHSSDTTFSFAFQEHRLFPNLTMLDNITQVLFKKATTWDRIDAKSILNKLGFTNQQFALYPSEMSGGMKQRVSLARAFLKDSSVFLLDEPTKELDPALIAKVADIIKDISKSKLVILATHDYEFLSMLNADIISI